ncbi:MAG: Tellurium resistance protein TerA [Alphaproteobacteria bacterium]|nr:Tellurium resistance protein TerA [Alphaproteobacteria bacterium]
MVKSAKNSLDSLAKASESIVDFSGHGAALGAAGYRMESDHPDNCEFLSEPGHSISISPKEGFDSIMIGAAWDNIRVENSGLFGKWFKKVTKVGVDLDIGCLYELQDGTRGAIQSFGEKFGDYDNPPFIALSGDDRTGDQEGHDEYLLVNGKKWNEIKRILVYIYIYKGAPTWSEIKPQVVVDVPGEHDFYVTLNAHDDSLELCAIAELESKRGGIILTNRTEYFPGHEEMDRAFGFGLNWADGQKRPA